VTSPRFDLQPALRGALLELRPLRPDDFAELSAAASDPGIWEQHPMSDRWKREVFEKFFAEALSSGGALVARERGTGRVVGSSRYYELDAANRTVVIGYTFLTRACWGGRHNAEFKTLMLDHAFRFVDAVLFHVDETNARSRRAMEKIGGVLAGRIEKTKPDGSPRAVLVYRIEKR
jgi:RimJ/RimL family protein N-acetyltransferase